MRIKNSFKFIIAALLVFPAFSAVLARENEQESKPFNLFDVMKEGQFVDQSPDEAIATIKGKKIIGLYFTAKWCGPCKKFTPKLVKFRNENKDAFQFIMMSWDTNLEQQKQYMEKTKMEVAAAECETHFVKMMSSSFRVGGVPTLLLFNSDGTFLSGKGQNHFTAPLHPDDFDELKCTESGRIWHALLLDKQRELRQERNEMVEELSTVVEEFKDFPYILELTALMGYQGQDDKINAVLDKMGDEIVFDWDNKKGLVDDLVVLSPKLKPNKKRYIGILEVRGGRIISKLGENAHENEEMRAKIEELITMGSYYKRWGIEALTIAAVTGDDEAAARIINAGESFRSPNAALNIFPVLSPYCKNNNERAVEIAVKMYKKNPYFVYLAWDPLMNAAYQGNKTAIEGIALIHENADEKYAPVAKQVLEGIIKKYPDETGEYAKLQLNKAEKALAENERSGKDSEK